MQKDQACLKNYIFIEFKLKNKNLKRFCELEQNELQQKNYNNLFMMIAVVFLFYLKYEEKGLVNFLLILLG